MIDLSRKRKIEITQPGDILIAECERHLESCCIFRYLQFFTYIAVDGKRWVEAVILNSFDHGKDWWKKTLKNKYHSIEWLDDTYEKAKEAWVYERNNLIEKQGAAW